jgi:hypothetical protein
MFGETLAYMAAAARLAVMGGLEPPSSVREAGLYQLRYMTTIKKLAPPRTPFQCNPYCDQ